MGNYGKARGAAPWIMLYDCSQQIINCFTWSVELLWTDLQRINYHVVLSVCSGNPISVRLGHDTRTSALFSVCSRRVERHALYKYIQVFGSSDNHIHILVFDTSSERFQQNQVRLTSSNIFNETSGFFQMFLMWRQVIFNCEDEDKTLGQCNIIKHVSKPDIYGVLSRHFQLFLWQNCIFRDIFLLRVQQQNQVFMVFLPKYLSILKKCFWWH